MFFEKKRQETYLVNLYVKTFKMIFLTRIVIYSDINGQNLFVDENFTHNSV